MSQESTDKAIPLAEEFIVNPIDKSLSAAEKANQLFELSKKNKPMIDAFIEKIDAEFGCKSTSNCKSKDRIVAKARRALLRADKPWFDVEHIRDGLRFRTALEDIQDLPKIIEALKKQDITIIKAETKKMLRGNIWGWRAVMYDIRLPDGQIVEYYLTVKEMMDANDNPHHALYEQWREKTTTEIEAKSVEFEESISVSKDAFKQALSDYFARTKQDESVIKSVIGLIQT